MEGRLSTGCPLICCEFTLPMYIRDLSSKSFHTWPHGPLRSTLLTTRLLVSQATFCSRHSWGTTCTETGESPGIWGRAESHTRKSTGMGWVWGFQNFLQVSSHQI